MSFLVRAQTVSVDDGNIAFFAGACSSNAGDVHFPIYVVRFQEIVSQSHFLLVFLISSKVAVRLFRSIAFCQR